MTEVRVVRSELPFKEADEARRAGMNLPAALVILDGWGIAPSSEGNAVSLADTPVIDGLMASYPWAPIKCSGLAVGLPEGQMGNSEVGHLNIGAGRVVYQELTRIDKAIEDGSLLRNPVLAEAIDAAVAEGRPVHLMGLVSPGGVHSHQKHLYALVGMALARGSRDVRIHALLDGRDTPPRSGLGYVESLEEHLRAMRAADGTPGDALARVRSVSGRYYAMDRDERWDRVELAWRALVLGEAATAATATAAIADSYAADVSDEFVMPTAVVAEGDTGPSILSDGDAFIFFNFRPDRAREITRALVDPEFDGFTRSSFPRLRFVCLTDYDPTIPAAVAFAKDLPCCTLADVLAEEGLRQLHIAETEKYAHVTFFLNGGAEPPKPGETRVLVSSPKVATYDTQPAMSAPQVTDELVYAIEAGEADVYIVNYANLDMVGHTGMLGAATQAVEVVDACLGRLVDAVRARGGELLITADHGNAEQMLGDDGHTPFTAHTTDEVPLLVVSDRVEGVATGGMLADVAASLVDLIRIGQPSEWTGRSLLEWR